MPIPTLQIKSLHEEHEDSHEPELWVKLLKWFLIVAAVAGISIFFIRIDKQWLYEHGVILSDTFAKLDVWIAEKADSFFVMFLKE